MDYLKYLTKEIHSTVMATVDENTLPVTCAIDIMDYDENGLYFLTAKGKNFYARLKTGRYVSLTGMKGTDTLSCIAISVRGKVEEVGNDYLNRLFEKNSYMYEIYPTKESRTALTVFRIYDGCGEWFDLSKKPIERESFSFFIPSFIFISALSSRYRSVFSSCSRTRRRLHRATRECGCC